MREVAIPPDAGLPTAAASFVACVATVLELRFEDAPPPAPDEDPASGGTVSRWLAGLGLGLVSVASPVTFSWPGPWIARVNDGAAPAHSGRYVVMYGVPSGVVWDPAERRGSLDADEVELRAGFVIAASDITQALPAAPTPPVTQGVVEHICVAATAGAPAQRVDHVRAIAGRGLEGDRHVTGHGTFPSGTPGSALTLIAAEVCESFTPGLTPSEHRRNLVTRGIDLNGLVGREFTVGEVPCRGMRLCEPCTVVQHHAGRPVLRALVHRGGLRADILKDDYISAGDPVRLGR